MVTAPSLLWMLSGGGGFDLPTDQPWVGAELSAQPVGDVKVAPTFRFGPSFGFGDRLPLAFTEIGVLVRIPEDEAVLRVGLVLRDTFVMGQYRMPIQAGDPAVGNAFGLLPGVLAVVQFEWTPEAPLVVALRGGPVSTASDYSCDLVNPDHARCITWSAGFGGGLLVRKTLRSGLVFEGSLGTTAWLTVGHTL